MKTIIAILKKCGGWRPSLVVRIENPPYLPLIVEAVDELGPLGFPALSVMHSTDEGMSAKRHPEMHFEVQPVGRRKMTLNPYYWRHDYVPAEQFSRFTTECEYVFVSDLHRRHSRFANEWDATLSRQLIERAFTDKCILG